MPVRIIKDAVTKTELKTIAEERFGDMVKAVVDIENSLIAVGGELHADEEAELLSQGSKQGNLWGINIYLDKPESEWIEFDSMINIRPSAGNRSRGVEGEDIRVKIIEIVNSKIKK